MRRDATANAWVAKLGEFRSARLREARLWQLFDLATIGQFRSARLREARLLMKH